MNTKVMETTEDIICDLKKMLEIMNKKEENYKLSEKVETKAIRINKKDIKWLKNVNLFIKDL